MSNQPKWTEELEATLTSLAGTEVPVSVDKVASIAVEMERTDRSIASKLRKMGIDVEKVGEKGKSFSDADEEALRAFVSSNPGVYTYKEIATQVLGDEGMAKQVQGKLLSMELTSSVKKTEAKVNVKTYTDEEEAVIVDMAKAGNFLEEIAEALDKDIKSVRGKCLSMLKSHGIDYPVTRDKKDNTKADVLAALEGIESMTVEAIVEATGKSVQGIKTMLTHRKISVADYDGAKRAAKIAAKKEAA